MMFRKALCLLVPLLSVLLCSALPAEAQRHWQPGDHGSFRVMLGYFHPDGSSEYWDDKFTDFTGSESDFNDFSFLMDYRLPVSEAGAFLFGAGWYEGATTQGYRDWVDGSGRPIRHRTSLRTFELTGAFIYEIGERNYPVTPYVGAGGGFLWWELQERGDFIDFTDDDLPIIQAWYGSNDVTFSLFALTGLDVRLGDAWSLVGQFRYRWADDELGGNFAGFGNLDLSGFDYTFGAAFHF
jgi:hypothetical protein